MESFPSLHEIADKTDIPIQRLHPTHINRNEELFRAGIDYAKRGGYVDFTTSTIPQFLEEGEVKCSMGLRMMLEEGVPVGHITFSSDGQASLPFFNSHGEYAGLQVGKVSSLYHEVRDSVLEEGIPLETALKVITTNPAQVLKLSSKGKDPNRQGCRYRIFAKGNIDNRHSNGKRTSDGRKAGSANKRNV